MNTTLPLDEELRRTTARLAIVEMELAWKTSFIEAQANSTIGAIIIVDDEGKKILQNQKVTEIFKIPPEIADSKDDRALVRWAANMTTNPAEFIEKIVHLYNHREEVSRDEVEMKDGTILDRYSSPVVGTEGTYFGRIWTFRDITERKRAESALRESDEKFRQLADNITDAFWIRSPDLSEVHYISPAFERIWGRSVASLYASPHEWNDFILPEDRDRVEAAFGGLTKSSPSLEIDYRIKRPSGEIRWIHERGFKIRNPSSNEVRHTGIVTDITGRRKAEAERDRLAAILESTTDLVGISDADWNLLYLNRAGRRMVGVGEDEDVSKIAFVEFLPDPANHPTVTEGMPMAMKEGTWSGEVALVSRSGVQVPVSQVILAHKTAAGKIEFLSTIMRDISVRRQLEARLFQSRKMETVGELAGGIAHEFNSILTAIIGQSELLLVDLPAGSPLVTCATEIFKAAGRAAGLTRQLLAYGRRQFLQPEVLDLNQVISDMGAMLHHVLGGDVSILVIPGHDLRDVKADAGQIEQVIVNMALNARDAMPNGGKFVLETSNVSIAKEDMGRYPELNAGDFVMLAVSDTGVGMPAEVQARVFEPFFSTKDVGKGTGLGLSSCYGIIKQSGGHISVYSEPGRGTTFKIYLPQVAGRADVHVDRIDSPDLPRGTETILLVEDDPALREMAATLLRRLGYKVHVAANGIEALALRQVRDVGHIDLLFTDVVMPHMSGKELSGRVQAANPHTRTLFTSAYTENAVVHQGVLDRGVALLPKPFTPAALARKLREVLDRPVEWDARDERQSP